MPLSPIRPNHEVLFWRQLFNLIYINRDSSKEEILEEVDKLKLLLSIDSTDSYDKLVDIYETEAEDELSEVAHRVYKLAQERSRDLSKWVTVEDVSMIIGLGMMTYMRYQNRMKPTLKSVDAIGKLSLKQLKSFISKGKLKDHGILDFQLGEKADQEFLALPYKSIATNLLSYSIQIATSIVMEVKYKTKEITVGNRRLLTGYILYEFNMLENLEEGFEFYQNGALNKKLRDRMESYEGTISENMKQAQISLEDIGEDLIEEIQKELGEAVTAILFILLILHRKFNQKN